MPKVLLGNGRIIDLNRLVYLVAVRIHGTAISAIYTDAESGLELRWSATLEEDANAVVQSLTMTAGTGVAIAEIVFAESVL